MRFWYLGMLALGVSVISAAVHAACPEGNTDPKCPNNTIRARQQAQQQAQQRAQQEAQQRAQQEAQQRAQQQAQQRAQQEAQQRAQQQAQQRAQQEAQQRAQQEAQQRAQQEAQQRAQQEAQQRAQQEAQQRAQKQAQERAQQQAQERTKQQAQERAKQQAQERAKQQAQERAKQQAQERSQKQGQERAQKQGQEPIQKQAQERAQQQAQERARKLSQEREHTQPPQHAPGAVPPQAQQRVPTTGAQLPQKNALGAAPQQRASGAAPPQVQQRAPVVVNATTSLVSRAGRGGFDINRRNPDGSELVVTRRNLPDGTPQVVGYKQTHEAASGTITRIYSDGHRVTRGRDFDSRGTYGGPTYINYRSGLRAAMLPNGKPMYRDSFAVRRGPDGREHRVIERIQYAQMVRGNPVIISRPIVRVYDPVTVYGAPVYLYRPAYFGPVFYRPFWTPFAVPVVVTQMCTICPAPSVAFAVPVRSYADPFALMGDLQISTAFENGTAYPPPSGTVQDRDGRALAEMRDQMTDLQQQVSANAQANEVLREQLADQGVQPRNFQVSTDTRKTVEAVGDMAPVQVSEDVRQQMLKQVRLNIAQHHNGHRLLLSDVIASGYAKIYIFQAAGLLDVSDVETGGVCFLGTGDLIGFASIPTGNNPVAEMKIISSGANSCRPKQVVQVRLADLQGMLNGFSERVEENMKRVSSCASAAGGCSRT